MFITICLLILAYSILGKPVGNLIKKLGDVNWKEKADIAFGWIKKAAKKLGRKMTETLLVFWYVMDNEETSTLDKILIFAFIAYVMIPLDFVPALFYSWLGILDDAVAMAFIYKLVDKNVSDDVKAKVAETMEEWFGPEEIDGETEEEPGIVF